MWLSKYLRKKLLRGLNLVQYADFMFINFLQISQSKKMCVLGMLKQTRQKKIDKNISKNKGLVYDATMQDKYIFMNCLQTSKSKNVFEWNAETDSSEKYIILQQTAHCSLVYVFRIIALIPKIMNLHGFLNCTAHK